LRGERGVTGGLGREKGDDESGSGE